MTLKHFSHIESPQKISRHKPCVTLTNEEDELPTAEKMNKTIYQFTNEEFGSNPGTAQKIREGVQINTV
jgi:hypothetical protein